MTTTPRNISVVSMLVVFMLAASSCSDVADAPDATVTSTAAPTTSEASTTTTAPTTTTVAPTTTTTEPPPPITAAIAELPTSCVGVDEAPVEGGAEVSFVVGTNLYVTDDAGTSVRCVAEVVPELGTALYPPPIEWGAMGDRVAVAHALFTGEGRSDTAAEFASAVHWTRPTGTSTIWIQDGRLLKQPIDGGDILDISFLATHDAAVYHPAGVEIVSSGYDADGVYGIYLASNVGTNGSRLVRSEDARITEMAWMPDGLSLFFIAVHPDHTDVHSYFFFGDQGDIVEESLFDEAIIQGDVFGLRLSPFDYRWAASLPCDADNFGSVLVSDYLVLPSEITEVSAEAVGWLPGGELVVLTRPVECDGPGDLWIVTLGGEGEPSSPSARLLYSGTELAAATGQDIQSVGVSTAAIRPHGPPPPKPLGEFDPSEFA